MLQNYYPQKDASDIQKLFGSGFTESLTGLAPGQWHGPVLSGYGTHLVYVHNVIAPPAPVFAEVLERVTQDWRMQRSKELSEQFYANLRDSYTVVVEEPETSTEGEKMVVVPEPSR